MNIIEYLNENGVQGVPNGGDYIAIQCPFCREEYNSGNAVGGFNINLSTNRGECGNSECHHKYAEFDEWSEALGISNKRQVREINKEDANEYALEKNTEPRQIIEGLIESLDEKYESKLEFKKLGDVMSKDHGPINWIVDKLIPADSFSVISGDPGNYKTWLTMDIAIRVSQGSPFLDYFGTNQCPVLIIDEENPERVVQNRLKLLGIEKNADLPIYYLNKSGFDITNKNNLVRLMTYIAENKIKLVIFDSLVRIHRGEENSARDMSAMYRRISTITKLGVSILATHHHRKGSEKSDSPQNLRGSSDIGAGIDAHLIVFSEKEENQLYISQPKLRSDEPGKPFVVGIVKSEKGGIKFKYIGEDNRKQKKIETIQNQIMEIIQNSNTDITVKDIIEKLPADSSPTLVRNALKGLDGNGLKSKKIKSGQLLYSLQTSEPVSS